MGKVDMPESATTALKHAAVGIITMICIFILSGFIISLSKHIALGEAITVALAFATGSDAEFITAGIALKTVYIFLSFTVSVLIFYIFWIVIELSISGQINEHFHGVSRMNKIKNLRDHYIVCGAGRVGKNVGQKLIENGRSVVFVEKESDVINSLRRKGYLMYETGPIDEEVLHTVGVSKAKALIASLGDDGKNLLLVLTARHINPTLKIAARIKDQNLIQKFKHAGADLVIIPEAVGGIKLAEALMGRIDHAHVVQL